MMLMDCLRNLLALYIIVVSLIPITTCNAKEYTHEDFVSDWSSPVNFEDSKNILIYGSLLTSGLIIFRNDTVEPFQESMVEQDLLGNNSHYVFLEHHEDGFVIDFHLCAC